MSSCLNKFKIDLSINKKKVLSNISWLTFDKVLRLLIALIVSMWMARYLGPERFGMLNYSLAFVALFSSVASLGIDSVVIRKLINSPQQKNEINGTTFILKIVSSIVCIVIIMFIIKALKPKNIIVQKIVLITALGFLFQSIDIIDYNFQAQVLSKYTVLSKGVSFIICNIIRIWLIINKFDLLAFAVVGVLDIAAGEINMLIVYYFKKNKLSKWNFNANTAKLLLKDSWPLMLSGISIMIYMRIDQIMIGNMWGDKQVGIYSAAAKIAEMWYFVPTAISSSVFPVIISAKKISKELYYKRLQQLYDVMSVMSISICIIITIFSKTIMKILYGIKYISGSNVLVIYVWAGVAVSLGVASSNYLVADNITKTSFYRTFLGAVLNVIMNFALIPVYGMKGAAFATLVSYSISTFSMIFWKKTRQQTINMLKSLNPIHYYKSYFCRRTGNLTE